MSEPSILLSGLVMGESPRWHDGRLWFADWGTGDIVAVDLAGTREVILHAPSSPFSFAFDPDGQLVVISGGHLMRQEANGSLVLHADLTGLSTKPWNEIVIDGRGNTYLNNIGFAFGSEEPAPGIIAVVTPDGAARQVADGVMFPNGMAVTPDNATLIVAESYGQRLTAFDIGADGGMSNRRVWAQVDGPPDGICLDTEDAVWYADVPNGHCVRVREGGDMLQTVSLDRGCFACVLGGVDRRMLCMVAAAWHGPERMFSQPPSGQVLTIAAPAPGAGWP